MIHLVLGGARSGKSRFAQKLTEQLSGNDPTKVLYVATATETDHEMRDRIAHHQVNRPAQWQLAEEPMLLAERIKHEEDASVILVDCLTLWLNNQLYRVPDQDFTKLFAKLTSVLKHVDKDVILVANEVGLGVVPMGEVTRQFVDLAGWLNQAVAATADQVTFVAAGLPMKLKG